MTPKKTTIKSDTLRVTELLTQEEKLAFKHPSKRFVIGIPAEESNEENRIALTPLTVDLLINNGHEVLIQSNAGKAANFFDHQFSDAGAIIVKNKEEIFAQSDVLVKVSPLTDAEIGLMHEGQILLSILHVHTKNRDYIQRLIQKRVTCIAFEYLKDENDCYPIVRSMSEIAGNTSILIAAEYLSNAHHGKGEMLGGITGVNPSEVVILGAGTAGEYAARTALGLGAIVKIFDTSAYKLKRLQNNIGQRIYTSVIHPVVLANALKTADVLIGALRVLEQGPRFYVTEEMIKLMKKGSVVIDISIDQGGCIETSRLTTHASPVFEKFGVVHYGVPNIASRVSRTASYALSNILAPLILDLGYAGSINNLIKQNKGYRNGVYVFNGILTNPYIGEIFDLQYKPIDLLLAAF
ncbi:MAG: alanine dehydrogenase [Bacteroidales bacterium]|nr:alanine dehydrogenase [Bacteroidales bacterium]